MAQYPPAGHTRELDPDKCKQLLQHPGQDRSTNHYNLDMILAAL